MIPWALYEYLMEGTDRDTIIQLRRGNKSNPGKFEQMVAMVCRTYASGHLQLRWMMPDPEGGPGAAFNRDNDMVAASDLVLAFFAPDAIMEGGTGHVVETAIDRGVPVYSFTVDEEVLARVGEHDPQASWQETIGAYFHGD